MSGKMQCSEFQIFQKIIDFFILSTSRRYTSHCFVLYNHCVCKSREKLKENLHNEEAQLLRAEEVWTEQVEAEFLSKVSIRISMCPVLFLT